MMNVKDLHLHMKPLKDYNLNIEIKYFLYGFNVGNLHSTFKSTKDLMSLVFLFD